MNYLSGGVNLRTLSAKSLIVIGLMFAWLGAWGTWLAHPAAGLTQTALSLAQVASRLPQVLYGSLGSIPEVLYSSLGLTLLALSVAAVQLKARALRYLLRGLALLLAIRLLPPYPDILQLWQSAAYGGQFVVAVLILIGWVLSLSSGRWPRSIVGSAPAVLALLALVAGLVSFVALMRAFSATTELAYAPGWGVGLYVMGLLLAAIVSLRTYRLAPLA